jgi:hypothetical protein
VHTQWIGVAEPTKEKTLERIRGYAVQGLDDLVPLANTLPAEVQNEIFTGDRITRVAIPVALNSIFQVPLYRVCMILRYTCIVMVG